MKIIQWDSEGLILTYKRMEWGKFHWPNLDESGTLTTIKRSDLKQLMKGLVMEQFVPRLNYVVIHYMLSDSEKSCSQCQGYLHEMKTVVRKELTVIPARIDVVERVQHVYTCRAYE